MEPFGRYILERRLAVGGMGEVFLAHQEGIEGFAKKLVIKRIKPTLADDAQFVEMFVNEARVAALIVHPNVVHIYELGKVEQIYFIAMEYVPGLSLATVLARLGGPLELPHALYVLNSVCEGLAHAHDAVGIDEQPLNLVHRDVSPPNILIGRSGTVKISDFGIAKVGQYHKTAVGVLKGKYAYLSPEQARGVEVDRRSDIYALGLVLFEMTVGQRANRATTDTGMIFAAANRDIPDPREVVPDYPEELRQMFLRATALELEERYAHVKEMQEELLAFQLDQRLVIPAGRVGEWLQSLEGEEGEDGIATAPGMGEPGIELSAAPAMAYEPTVHALQRNTEPHTPVGDVVLEVDLEREGAWGEESGLRRVGPSSHRLFIVGAVLLVLLLGLVYGLAHWRQAGEQAAPTVDAGADGASRPVARRPKSTRPVAKKRVKPSPPPVARPPVAPPSDRRPRVRRPRSPSPPPVEPPVAPPVERPSFRPPEIPGITPLPIPRAPVIVMKEAGPAATPDAPRPRDAGP